MKYYIIAIEQIIKDGAYSEYVTSEKVDDKNLAFSKYFTKLANVSNDLEKNHTYMDIRILNSYGGEEKRDAIGTYVEE